MQSKQELKSKRWTAAILPLSAVVMLGSATLLAHAEPAGPVAASPRLQADTSSTQRIYFADPDRDVGPGEAESMLAQHPD